MNATGKGAAAAKNKQPQGGKPRMVPPAPPGKVDPKTLPVTDPRRKLSKEEREQLTDEQRKERRENRKKNRAPLKQRLTKFFVRSIKRTERFAAMFEGKEVAETRNHLVTAVSKLRAALSSLDELPPNWQPAKVERGARDLLAPGTVVRLSESKREQYASIVPDDEMDKLKIVQVIGKKYVLETPTKLRMFLPAAHVKTEQDAPF